MIFSAYLEKKISKMERRSSTRPVMPVQSYHELVSSHTARRRYEMPAGT